MGLKSLIIQIGAGAVGFALLIQCGYIRPEGPFLDNAMWGAVNMLISRVVGWIFGGKSKK